MKYRKKIAIALMLILLAELLCSTSLAAQADTVPDQEATAQEAEPADASDESAEEEDYFPVLDQEELNAIVEDFMAKRGIKADRFAVSYFYTGTEEGWSKNGDWYTNGASLYKLSLMMGLARKVSAGELSQEDKINGMTISYIEKRALTYSDNNVGEQIITYFCNQLGSFRAYRLMQAGIAGVPEEDLPASYFSSNEYSTNYMMGVLKELYYNQEKYPSVIDYLLLANTDGYLHIGLNGGYPVAQKYGGGDGYFHIAGIVYTPTPFLVSIMSYRVSNAASVIVDLCRVLTDYTLTLDARIAEHQAELERQAEEARRAEEEARLAAEAEERARLEAEEAARRAEEEARQAAIAAREEAERAAAMTPAPQQSAETAPSDDASALRLIVIGIAALTAVLIAVGAYRQFGKKKSYR